MYKKSSPGCELMSFLRTAQLGEPMLLFGSDGVIGGSVAHGAAG